MEAKRMVLKYQNKKSLYAALSIYMYIYVCIYLWREKLLYNFNTGTFRNFMELSIMIKHVCVFEESSWNIFFSCCLSCCHWPRSDSTLVFIYTCQHFFTNKTQNSRLAEPYLTLHAKCPFHLPPQLCYRGLCCQNTHLTPPPDSPKRERFLLHRAWSWTSLDGRGKGEKRTKTCGPWWVHFDP